MLFDALKTGFFAWERLHRIRCHAHRKRFSSARGKLHGTLSRLLPGSRKGQQTRKNPTGSLSSMPQQKLRCVTAMSEVAPASNWGGSGVNMGNI